MIPRLRKQPEKKSCHGYNWVDDYSWVHQDNCLEILRDTSKVNPEVRKYLESENAYTKVKMADTEEIQKKIFKEIEGRIKLDDESLPYKDKKCSLPWVFSLLLDNSLFPLKRRKRATKTMMTMVPGLAVL